jgi:hypothetical protein
MTLQLQLEPAAETNLQEAAKDQGVSPEVLAKATLEQAFGTYAGHRQPNPEGVLDLLTKFAEWGKGLPDLPDSALTRESFYERD